MILAMESLCYLIFTQNEVILKRNSLEVYHAYIKDLFDDNVSMITAIVEIEEKTVNKL